MVFVFKCVNVDDKETDLFKIFNEIRHQIKILTFSKNILDLRFKSDLDLR